MILGEAHIDLVTEWSRGSGGCELDTSFSQKEVHV